MQIKLDELKLLQYAAQCLICNVLCRLHRMGGKELGVEEKEEDKKREVEGGVPSLSLKAKAVRARMHVCSFSLLSVFGFPSSSFMPRSLFLR